MRLSERNKIILPLMIIALFVFSSFGWIFYFQNYQSKEIIETVQLLNRTSGDIKEFNRTIQSSILTMDDKYAVKSAVYSLRVFDNLDRLRKMHPGDADRLGREYMDYYAKLVSISSLFLEKRREEGTRHLAELEMSYEKINREISLVLDDETKEYVRSVRNINIFMIVTAFVFALVVSSIIGLFMHYSIARKKAEDALKDAKDYTDNIVKSMADGLIVVNPDATIHTVNNALCALLGYAEEELIGQPMSGIVEEDGFMDALLVLMGEGLIRDYQMTYVARNGEKIPVSLHVSAMHKQDGDTKKVVGIIFIARDIREIKQLQKQVIQSEKMASLGTMSAGVAHEIKNPLAIILQGIEYLKSVLSADASALAVTEKILNAVLRADRIVKGLMNFTRQTSLIFEKSDIDALIEEALSLVENQFTLRKIKIVRDFASGLCRPEIDCNQMKQVFINILLNAADAMPDGGTITISVQSAGTHLLKITFTDTGRGISVLSLSKVFDPFFTTKQTDGNTGLGLSIARGIIEEHNGTISLESEVGKGTSVTIGLTCV